MRKNLLFKILPLLLLISSIAWAQERIISGKVSSVEDGSALPGVNVVVKGTTNGTVTDADGKYSLSVPTSDASLVFSFIGLKTSEILVGERTVVDIQLGLDITQLSEVVVTAGGISRESRTLGYAVATVKNDFLTQAQVTNAAAALSGKVSGLQINQTDNGVNGSVRIVLRGNRSILGNNQALLVVDGSQVPSDYLNSINPNDIESTTILKGASAAALYGSQASNGVLIINTKRGSKAPEIQVQSTTQLDQVSYFPKLQTRFGGYGGEGPGADVFTLNPTQADYVAYENQSYGPEFNGRQVQLGRPIYLNGIPTYQYTTYSAKPNEHYNFFKTGVTAQNSASVSAGTDKSKFFFSFQDVNKSGTIPQDVSRRDVMRFNSTTIYDNFQIGFSASYTMIKSNQSGNFGGAYADWFNTQLQVPVTQYSNPFDNTTLNGKFSGPTGYYDDFFDNPYYDLYRSRAIQDRQDFQANVDLSLKATSWLTFTEKFSVYNSGIHQQNTNLGTTFDKSFANPSKYSVQQGNTASSVSDTYSNTNKIVNTFVADFHHQVTQDFNFRALLGSNMIFDKFNNANIGSNTLLPLDPIVYNATYRNGNLTGGTRISNQTLIGFFGDLSLTYKYLTLHGSLRNDQTSLLAADARSFTYPEADLAFVFTEAIPGLKESRIISFGKLAISASKVGQVNADPYSLQTPFNAGIPYSGSAGNVPVNYLGARTVGTLKPEFTFSREVNLEMGFLNNRILFKTAYYETNTTNQTLPFDISRATGYGSALVNTGEMVNKGLEMDLTFNAITTSSGFKWSISPNYTYLIDNSIKSIYTSPAGDVTNSVKITNNGGNALDAYAVVGLQYPTIRVSDWSRDPQGRVIVDATTGLPSVSPNLVVAGQGQPKHRLGIQNNFSYKGFSLGILMDYRAGAVIYNQIGNSIEFGGIGYVSASAGRQRFVYPNSVYSTDGGTTYTSNTSVTVNDGNYNFWQNLYNNIGTNYISSADFWKLREVALSYRVPAAILSKTKIVKAATITLTGRNLLMWRPQNNQWTDPEFATDNSNALGTTNINQSPPSRTYGVSVLLTF